MFALYGVSSDANFRISWMSQHQLVIMQSKTIWTKAHEGKRKVSGGLYYFAKMIYSNFL